MKRWVIPGGLSGESGAEYEDDENGVPFREKFSASDYCRRDSQARIYHDISISRYIFPICYFYFFFFAMNLSLSNIVCWTNSSIVLDWISASAKNYKVFVQIKYLKLNPWQVPANGDMFRLKITPLIYSQGVSQRHNQPIMGYGGIDYYF